MEVSGYVTANHPLFPETSGGATEPGSSSDRPFHHESDVRGHDEILHRAAAGDATALDSLLEVSLPLIRQKCPSALRHHIDDVQQIVAYRLMRKFRSPTRPYQASTFFAYRRFVNQVTMNVAITIWHRESQTQSLEELNEATGFEPARRSEAEQVDARLRLERCLELLPDPLIREVFRLRFLLNASVEETLVILQRQGQPVSKRDVYRLAERSILYLSKLPEVRDMFENIDA